MVLFFLIEIITNIFDIEVNRFLVHFIGLVLITYLTKKNVMGLFYYSNIATFVIVTADVFISRYMISNYFDYKLNVFDAAHSMMIVLLSIVSFSFLTFEDFHKLEISAVGGEHKDLIATALIYKVFNFYNIYYYDTHDVESFIKYSIIEFVINNAFFLIYNTLNFFKIKENRSKYLFLILKRLILMMILRLIYSYLFTTNIQNINDIINKITNFFSNKINHNITKKSTYFNVLSYFTFLILELI